MKQKVRTLTCYAHVVSPAPSEKGVSITHNFNQQGPSAPPSWRGQMNME
jgi:hypothetical protein